MSELGNYENCEHEFGEFEGIAACRHCGLADWSDDGAMDYVDEVDEDALDDEEEDEQSVEEYLDDMDLDRMEWERMQQDIYPDGLRDGEPDGPMPPHVHRDTDAGQKWLAKERQEIHGSD